MSGREDLHAVHIRCVCLLNYLSRCVVQKILFTNIVNLVLLTQIVISWHDTSYAFPHSELHGCPFSPIHSGEAALREASVGRAERCYRLPLGRMTPAMVLELSHEVCHDSSIDIILAPEPS